MDGENNGKPYEQMDDLGVFPYFWVDTHISSILCCFKWDLAIFGKPFRRTGWDPSILVSLTCSDTEVQTCRNPNLN